MDKFETSINNGSVLLSPKLDLSNIEIPEQEEGLDLNISICSDLMPSDKYDYILVDRQ